MKEYLIELWEEVVSPFLLTVLLTGIFIGIVFSVIYVFTR